MVSSIYWIQLILYSGMVLYAPCLALEATTRISKTASIIIIGLVCTFYSSTGGIKAVLITDTFQGLLMFASVFLIIGTATYNVGGLGQIWEIARQGQRLEFDRYCINFFIGLGKKFLCILPFWLWDDNSGNNNRIRQISPD